ncbi:MAG: S9 family peptidase [Acidobacteriota bacterium]
MPKPKQIPRAVLFGNPTRSSPRLSPDGRSLAFLAPSPSGVLNVWQGPADGQEFRQVTNDTYRGIRSYFWAEDSRHLLYLQDSHGDENFHVFAVDLHSGTDRDLTPYPSVKAQNIMLDKDRPGEILVGLNRRDESVFDMYRVQVASGETALDTENPGDVVGWLTDQQFAIRGAVSMDPDDGSTALRVRDTLDAPWRQIQHWPFGEEGGPEDFSVDGKSLLVSTSLGSDTTRLVRIDAASGAELEEIVQHPQCDVGGVMLHPDTRAVQLVGFNYLRQEWRFFDPQVEADFALLRTVESGDVYCVSRNSADTVWIVAFTHDAGPVAWYHFDRATRQARKLFVNQPELLEYTLAPMEPLTIASRDGMTLPAYLTRPLDAGPGPYPMVLYVHGGPWARDTWGYDPSSQWLANRGYAVLKVNYRGSTGFGKQFINAGNYQWGVGTMQHDLTDAVQWAIANGIADPKRVAIMGGSYGGYATLAGLAFTPELYACGIDIVGPSNIRTLLQSVPPYWKPMRKIFDLRVGAADQDEDWNRKISPCFHADKVRAPLIIAQGANDPRVKIAESDQMVEAMRAQGNEVAYVVYPDEGHGFARPDNRLDFYGRVEEFLRDHLGGRAEPWVAVEGATAELR